MNNAHRWWVAIGGGALVAAVVGVGVVMAQSPTPNSGTPSASGTPKAEGTFTSNEDATHEAGESADVEAGENSGQRPHGHGGFRGGKSNEDPAHEANESADHEAQEDAAASSTPTSGQ